MSCTFTSNPQCYRLSLLQNIKSNSTCIHGIPCNSCAFGTRIPLNGCRVAMQNFFLWRGNLFYATKDRLSEFIESLVSGECHWFTVTIGQWFFWTSTRRLDSPLSPVTSDTHHSACGVVDVLLTWLSHRGARFVCLFDCSTESMIFLVSNKCPSLCIKFQTASTATD